MKVILKRNSLLIRPEDEGDTAFLEDTLGITSKTKVTSVELKADFDTITDSVHTIEIRKRDEKHE